MDDIIQGFAHAARLLVSGEQDVWGIVFRSLIVSGVSTALGCAIGIPLGAAVGLRRFRGKRAAVAVLNVGMSLPPVVVGLFVYLLLSRSGPLGFVRLLYSVSAMVIAQTILAAPLVAALTVSAVESVDRRARTLALSLGASELRATLTLLGEARFAMGAAVIAGFGAVISEVGAVMIVGGNIAGHTRVMTTAIVLETGKGQFDIAIALGIILLLIAFVVNFGLGFLQRGR
ncbi:MAG: ABC transporter permease [Armatimonadota bacterium]|nr:MAG: ABC transporter permease [Armatimonadota bacterium]